MVSRVCVPPTGSIELQPPTCVCGDAMYRDGELWQCGQEHCRNYERVQPLPADEGAGYRDLVTGDRLQVGDEGFIDGKWVSMAPAFAGHYYVPGLMARMRRKWPCLHDAGGWQFEGDLLCRKCNEVID